MDTSDLKIGDKINAILLLDQIDLGSEAWPFGFKILGCDDEYVWLNLDDVENIKEAGNPELKKARIEREILSLQKQLEELK